jgi:hypothetical protein
MTELERDGRLILTWRWNTLPVGAVLMGGWTCLVTLASSLTMCIALLEGDLWALPGFLLGLVICGGIAALCLAQVINRTELTWGDSYFTVRSFPLWWGAPVRISGEDIVALRLERYRSNKRVRYALMARRSDGRELAVVDGLEELQGQALQERLELVLGFTPDGSAP